MQERRPSPSLYSGLQSMCLRIARLTARLSSGHIEIDGLDISTLGLDELRSRIAIIPQEPILFSGTLRSNLDPFDSYDDDTLHDAMKRACLSNGQADKKQAVNLDTEIEDEGSNLSKLNDGADLTSGVGQRSLVSLARALVKDVRVSTLEFCFDLTFIVPNSHTW